MGPVSHVPAGTTTRPPPDWLHASIALVIAFVLSTLPPLTAPKSVIIKSLSG